jgi:surfactin synthase thioesterase subunit
MTAPALQSSTWIRRFQPVPQAGTRLICFPHAGGSASYFFPLSRALAPAAEVVAVQYPGRQDRRHERCIEDLHELAALTTEQVRPWLDRPTVLFGLSLGATLAFEVARRLQQQGCPPLGLFAAGRRAPSRFRDERVHLMSDQGLVADLRRLSGTDTRMLEDEETLRMILPALRSDYKAAETYRYRPGPDLGCPLTVLTGDQDPHVTEAEAQAWGGHTSGPFELHTFTGGHFFISDHVAPIAALVDRSITAWQQQG